MKTNKNNKCFISLPTTIETREQFKTYCREQQGCSVVTGINLLMQDAVENNVKLKFKKKGEVVR